MGSPPNTAPAPPLPATLPAISRTKDEKRNQFLAAQGIKVLRFWNHQLRGELEAVRFEIWHALMERTGGHEEIAGYQPAPSPQPSPPMGARESESPAAIGTVQAPALRRVGAQTAP